MSEQVTTVEWRVETDQTEDEFGTDEQAARDWLARCKDHPDWRPAVLMCRTVTISTGEWTTIPTEARATRGEEA